jgi:hypothetical protein
MDFVCVLAKTASGSRLAEENPDESIQPEWYGEDAGFVSESNLTIRTDVL